MAAALTFRSRPTPTARTASHSSWRTMVEPQTSAGQDHDKHADHGGRFGERSPGHHDQHQQPDHQRRRRSHLNLGFLDFRCRSRPHRAHHHRDLDQPSLVPTNGFTFTGTSSNHAVGITALTNAFGTTEISLVVADPAGGKTTNTFC